MRPPMHRTLWGFALVLLVGSPFAGAQEPAHAPAPGQVEGQADPAAEPEEPLDPTEEAAGPVPEARGDIDETVGRGRERAAAPGLSDAHE